MMQQATPAQVQAAQVQAAWQATASALATSLPGLLTPVARASMLGGAGLPRAPEAPGYMSQPQYL